MTVVVDFVAVAACVGVSVVMAVGIFGQVEGGSLKTNDWFGWHPVLMTIAIPSLMTLGRYAYVAEGALEMTKSQRRSAHRGVMTAATLVVIAGYVAIFMSHLKFNKFFGYDFEKKEWAEWRRTAHAWLGYAVLLLSLAQASMGMMKKHTLETTGERRFTFHGSLGKWIMGLGCLNVLLAAWFWKWSAGLKAAVVLATCVCAAVALLLPTAPSTTGDQGDAERMPITQS
eukprot:TRINITY_DN66279_c0_g1_i1.p1 TRINITY_DN66279_c0_g1~~TRINITY_DN66279_c0_g1_i1.p1  ORF type:complete len:228 (-),score=54.09 TRINITY_DN66279_c0_g1_i1:88-771(-)